MVLGPVCPVERVGINRFNALINNGLRHGWFWEIGRNTPLTGDRSTRKLAAPVQIDRIAWDGITERGEIDLTEIRLKKGEPVEKALRRLKKRLDREGTLREVRNHRHFEKPSERRRRKMKVAKFSAMLSARYANM